MPIEEGVVWLSNKRLIEEVGTSQLIVLEMAKNAHVTSEQEFTYFDNLVDIN